MTKYPRGSERELKHSVIARRAAAESMVLLKNDNETLPLIGADKKPFLLAVFGIGQIYTFKGGTGSGEVNNTRSVNILDGLRECARIKPDERLAAFYVKWAETHPNRCKNGFPFDSEANNPEPDISPELLGDAAESCEAAVVVISRLSGEGRDRKLEKGDYYLTDEELCLIDAVCGRFARTALLLNTAGIIDLSPVVAKFGAILFCSLPGGEGGNAVADILSGEVAPSGKLTDTWAARYEDYGSAADFGDPERVEYRDGVYVGYRYFDSFGVNPLYPFGFGLSYADFCIESCLVTLADGFVHLTVSVKNLSEKYAGKEVVQVYYEPPEGKLKKPRKSLAAFAKTGRIEPGKAETVNLSFRVREMASYSEKTHEWLLEAGDYYILVGSSSDTAAVAAAVRVPSDSSSIVVRNLCGRPGIKEIEPPERTLTEDEKKQRSAASKHPYTVGRIKTRRIDYSLPPAELTSPAEPARLGDMSYENIKNVVASMNDREVCSFVCGIGFAGGSVPAPAGTSVQNDGVDDYGIEFGATMLVAGAAGQTADFSEQYGIPPMVLADGPAGIRLQRLALRQNGTQFRQSCTAFPAGTLLASSWDTELLRKVGEAIGHEAEEYGVWLWLAPGMNIHRNPLCGRNFEYFSEDPLLTGKVAAAISRGVGACRAGVTIKHFAANNQEDGRTHINTLISERALREIYLKGFEIAVKEGAPAAIMTSYNDINGVPAADNRDLCTLIARDEWGFRGLIMTDWGGGRSTEAISMYAGNDMIQPGGAKAAERLYAALQSGEPVISKGEAGVSVVLTRAMLQQAAINILGVIVRIIKN